MLTVPGVTNYGSGKLIDFILEYLFINENKRTKELQIEIVRKNRNLRGDNNDGFFYQGNFYSDFGSGHIRAKKSIIHTSLINEMDAIIADKKTIENEQGRIRQALALILKPCRSNQDIRDALPNFLAAAIPDVAVLERARPEAYTIEDNSRAKEQYQALRPKMEFYSAMKLMY